MANNFEKLIATYASQIQELEGVFFEILEDTTLDGSIGQQLDNLGTIVKILRGALSDDRYRNRISAQILANLSSGTIPQILAILKLIVAADVVLEFLEEFPAHFSIEANPGLPTGQGDEIAALLDTLEVGGVRGLFKFHVTDPVFAFDSAGGSKFDGGYFMSTVL